MKSSVESRKLFREKIESAISKTSNSDELKSALSIIDDLDSALNVMALSAEYNYRMRKIEIGDCSYEYEDELEEVYDLYIRHLDLFLGVGVFGGVWRNSQHWIATTFARLFKSSKSKSTFTPPSLSPINITYTNPNTPSAWPYNPTIPYNPPNPYSTNPYMNFYVDGLKKILHEIGAVNSHNIKVTLKSNGYFELSSSKNKIYLKFEYVIGKVTILDDKLRTIDDYSDTETIKIAAKIKGVLL
jgi:hypothetical protein